jgi:hypothetical protein
VKHIMDAPLHGKLESIVDGRHHLDDLERSVAFGSEFRGWLVSA